MSSLRSILVTESTGKQGGALISALLAEQNQQFEIYALTRNKTSAIAQRLATHSNVRVIEGDLDHIDAVFEQVSKPLWGLFLVPILDKGVKKEEQQSRDLMTAAIEAGLSHVVYTTTDRGGDAGEDQSTPVPHFASKFKVEQFIRAKAAESKLTYTFIRPVAFYENFEPGFFGSAHMTMWSMDGVHTKLQMVSTKDIGKVAAQAFVHADEPQYKNMGISVAGDSLTATEVAKVFKEETGKTIPKTYWLIAAAVRYLIYDLRMMYSWFYTDGFKADMVALKKDYPFMLDFRTWLRQESKWSKP